MVPLTALHHIGTPLPNKGMAEPPWQLLVCICHKEECGGCLVYSEPSVGREGAIAETKPHVDTESHGLHQIASLCGCKIHHSQPVTQETRADG